MLIFDLIKRAEKINRPEMFSCVFNPKTDSIVAYPEGDPRAQEVHGESIPLNGVHTKIQLERYGARVTIVDKDSEKPYRVRGLRI